MDSSQTSLLLLCLEIGNYPFSIEKSRIKELPQQVRLAEMLLPRRRNDDSELISELAAHS